MKKGLLTIFVEVSALKQNTTTEYEREKKEKRREKKREKRVEREEKVPHLRFVSVFAFATKVTFIYLF